MYYPIMSPSPSYDEECPPTGGRVATMPPVLRLGWLIGFCALIALLTAWGRPGGGALTGPVVRVIDGDTFQVKLGDRTELVRYIGINAPEINHPSRGEEPGGREAAAVNRRLVQGRRVQLELDVEERDAYGRLLAYAYVGDLMVNAELVRRGYAQVMTIPPNVRHQDLFVKLEREAREQMRGLWAEPASFAGLPR